MNLKKYSRNGDDFVRGVQESQAWAAEPSAGRGDKSALQGCLCKESNREEKNTSSEPLYNVGMKLKVCKVPTNRAQL